MYKDRRQWIKDELTRKGIVSYTELFGRFPEVSHMTLRRDIDHLVTTGAAVKVRGGAKSPKFITEYDDAAYDSRLTANISSKIRIAKTAAAMFEEGRSIFLDSGSTVLQTVPFIPNERFVFTVTSPITALELCRIGKPSVTLVGGRFDREYQSVYGTQAMRFLQDINIDTAFLCPSGLSLTGGFTGGNPGECELKHAVAAKARKVIMLMDISKADKCLPYTFCSLSDVDTLICDAPLPKELQSEADRAGVETIYASVINK